MSLSINGWTVHQFMSSVKDDRAILIPSMYTPPLAEYMVVDAVEMLTIK